ncbi:MAG: hypothetical protein AAFQ82_21445 [Myxococcota bacterium]
MMHYAALSLCTFLTATPVTVEDAEFLGFSADESLAAWHLVMTERTPQVTVRYPVIQLVQTENLRVLNEFRAGAARNARTGAVIPPRRVKSRRWQRAKGLSQWRRFQRKTPVELAQGSDITDAIDVETRQGFVTERERGLVLSGPSGLAFRLSTELSNGDRTQIGTFGDANAQNATVRVFVSPTGHHLAVQGVLELTSGAHRAESVIRRVTRFPVRARPQNAPANSGQVRSIYGEDGWGLVHGIRNEG